MWHPSASGSHWPSAQHAFSLVDGAVSWAIAGLLVIAPLRARYVQRGRSRSRAHGVVRHRGHAGRDRRAGGDGAAPAGGMARGARCRGRRRHGPGPLGTAGQRESEDGAPCQPVPGPGAGGVRLRPGGLGHLPRGRPGPRPRARHDGRQGGPGPLHGRLRGGGRDLRAGALALPRVLHPVRLRVARGPRRDSAHVRQPHDPGHPHGRAAAPAGRVAAQDVGPFQRGDLHRCRRGARADRLGSRPRTGLHRGVAAGAPRRHPGRSLGNGVGLHLAALAAGRAGRRAAPGGAGEPRRRAARAHRGRAQPRRPARSPRTTTGC